MNYLNGIFLVFPPVGAAVAGILKIYFLPITAILQVSKFGTALIPERYICIHIGSSIPT